MESLTLFSAEEGVFVDSKQPAGLSFTFLLWCRIGWFNDFPDIGPHLLHRDIRGIQLDEDCIAVEFRRNVADCTAPAEWVEYLSPGRAARKDTRPHKVMRKHGIM